MIKTDRTELLQVWYQALHGVQKQNQAEVEQVMEITEKAQIDAIKSASPESNAIDLYA